MKIKFLVLFFLLVFAATAQAAYVRTSYGNGADTFLSNDSQTGSGSSNGAPTATHGTEGSLAIRYWTGTRVKIAYLRFDISDNEQFVGVTGARLGFNFTSSNRARTLGVYGLVNETLDNWVEATIDYNNAPGFIPNPPTLLGYYAMNANLVRVADFPVLASAGNYLSTPSAAMDSFINSDTNKLLTFVVLKEGTDSNASYWVTSKEGNAALAPVLVPEPATIALLGLGSLALLRLRRKR